MTTQPTLFDFRLSNPSDSGQTSGRKDVPGGPHGSVSPTSPSGTPQDTTKNAKAGVPKVKTTNHTPEGLKTQNKRNNGVSRTRWTDEDWRKEYWRDTNEHPKQLLETFYREGKEAA